MNFTTYTPKDYTYYTNITRNYDILKFTFSDFTSKEKLEIINEANHLYNNTNSKGANTGLIRNNMTKWNDCIAGILAEFAVANFLSQLSEVIQVTRPKVISSKNQVDLILKNKNNVYDIEVRSSFVKNGIEFALYGIDRNNTNAIYKNKNYFDILGPYKQQVYKEDFESTKDLYFRVLFNGKKYDVENRFIKNNESFYIIGAIKGKDLIELNYLKTLKTSDAINIIPGNYYVAPIKMITDAKSINQLL